MRLETNNIEVRTPAAGLRCLWTLSEDEQGAYLTAHWVGDVAERREQEAAAGPFLGNEDSDGQVRFRISSCFVWD